MTQYTQEFAMETALQAARSRDDALFSLAMSAANGDPAAQAKLMRQIQPKTAITVKSIVMDAIKQAQQRVMDADKAVREALEALAQAKKKHQAAVDHVDQLEQAWVCRGPQP